MYATFSDKTKCLIRFQESPAPCLKSKTADLKMSRMFTSPTTWWSSSATETSSWLAKWRSHAWIAEIGLIHSLLAKVGWCSRLRAAVEPSINVTYHCESHKPRMQHWFQKLQNFQSTPVQCQFWITDSSSPHALPTSWMTRSTSFVTMVTIWTEKSV